MKKVGLVTIYDNTNFGNRLQNYALQHILERDLGAKCITLVSQMDFVGMIKVSILSMLSKTPIGFVKKRSATDLRYDVFRRFTSRYIRTKIFWGEEQLPHSINNKFDIFIAGSDQIWNWRLPVVRKHANDFFLCFAEEKKKNSYAASFGVDSLEEECLENYRKKLKTFNSLSVREEAGRRIISRLIGISASLNIDPTLLLTSEEWEKIERKPKYIKTERPYILKYFLGEGMCQVEKDIDNIASSRKLNKIDLLNKEAPEYISGPAEFLYYVRHADLICTDSFHATVFSIIFNRPFIVVSRKGMNSRIETLLKSLKLEERFVGTRRIKESDYNQFCDYEYAHEVIAREKIISINYLKTLLE